MKKFAITAAFLMAATAATADEKVLSPFVGLERETGTNVNRAFVGADLAVPNTIFTVGTRAEFEDVGSLTGMSFTKAELNLNANITDNASLYLENDLNSDFKRTETTVGVKLSF